MTAKELMIGDWVECVDSTHKEKVYAQIDAIEEGQTCILVRLDNRNWFLDISFIKPIPLTQEILEKNGFRKCEGNEFFFFKKEEGSALYQVLWSSDELYLEIDSYTSRTGEFNRMGVEFVHQLQHALRLCGIDKEIVL